MDNILIPTDFSAASLDFISQIAKVIPGKINIILFHALDMPKSLLDAMRRTGMGEYGSMVTEELRLKCKRIKAENKNINNISYKLMYGTTPTAFNDYTDTNGINMIAVPPAYQFAPVVRESVNPKRMFQKSGLPKATSIAELQKLLLSPTLSKQPADNYNAQDAMEMAKTRQ